jgi:hypothetical protein
MAGVSRNPNFVMPHVRAFNSANISIPNSAFTAVTLDSERWDTGTATEQHSTSTNTDRLTCRQTGLYVIGANIEWASSALGERIVSLMLNGSTEVARARQAPSAGETAQNIHTQYRLTSGDYVNCQVFQNSGGALNAQSSSAYAPEVFMCYLSA